MNRFKKGIAIYLVATIFLTTLLGNSAFSFLQTELRNEVTARWNELIEVELVELEVSQKVALKIQANHSREFFSHNQWYDVVSLKKVNGKWMLRCYSDQAETDLETSNKQPSQKHQMTFDWFFSQAEILSIAYQFCGAFVDDEILTPTPQLFEGKLEADFSPPELLG